MVVLKVVKSQDTGKLWLVMLRKITLSNTRVFQPNCSYWLSQHCE